MIKNSVIEHWQNVVSDMLWWKKWAITEEQQLLCRIIFTSWFIIILVFTLSSVNNDAWELNYRQYYLASWTHICIQSCVSWQSMRNQTTLKFAEHD